MSAIGFHLCDNLYTCIIDAKKKNYGCLQIFLPDPRFTINKIIKKHNMIIFIHASYLLSFCNPLKSKESIFSQKELIYALNTSVLLNIKGVIIHMGRGKSNCKENYINNIIYVLKNSHSSSVLILETGASVGNEINSSLHELFILFSNIKKHYPNRIKICIDTCHVWSSGYNIKSLYSLIKKEIGWSNVACIHLNDSKNKKGSKIDRHADIGTGYIPLKDLEAFVKKVSDNEGIPIILETPCDTVYYSRGVAKLYDDMKQINLVRKWIKDK
jgi:deoxyribonuclease-4